MTGIHRGIYRDIYIHMPRGSRTYRRTHTHTAPERQTIVTHAYTHTCIHTGIPTDRETKKHIQAGDVDRHRTHIHTCIHTGIHTYRQSHRQFVWHTYRTCRDA